jgi:hypothetical protein
LGGEGATEVFEVLQNRWRSQGRNGKVGGDDRMMWVADVDS